MNRGPGRGLGTFPCRCGAWLLLLLLVSLAALAYGTRVRPPTRNRLGAAAPTDFDPSRPPFHQVKASYDMLANRGQIQQHYPPTPTTRRGGSNKGPTIIRLMSKSSLFLQIFPNGSVSATAQDTNIFSVLERSAVQIGLVFLRGIASRQYLCLNRCGLLYGSKNLTDECILHENIENNWYNTYTSQRYSSNRRSLYVAISGSGSSCRLRLNATVTRQGRTVAALGVNEKFTQFFPVWNITLPAGMTLASLIEIGQNWSSRDLGIPAVGALGCAPQCNKQTTGPSGKKRPKCRHKHCATSSPAKGGGGGEGRPAKGKKEPGGRSRNKDKEKTKNGKAKNKNKLNNEENRISHKLRHVYRKIRAHPDVTEEIWATDLT